MKFRPLHGLLRRPTPPSAPVGPDEDALPGVYLSEPPAPDTDRESNWCVWPDESDSPVQEAVDAARDARLAVAVAARQAALDAAWARSEDPWAVLHAQRHDTTPAG